MFDADLFPDQPALSSEGMDGSGRDLYGLAAILHAQCQLLVSDARVAFLQQARTSVE